MAMVRVALLAFLLTSCGDANAAATGSVVEAHVVRVIENGERTVPGVPGAQLFQRLEVRLDSSLFRGETQMVEWSGHRALDTAGLLHEGDRVLLSVLREGDKRTYTVQEVVRIPQLAPLAALLVVALLLVARLAGLAALAGVAVSVGVLLLAVVPTVQRGGDPLVATLVGSAAAVAVAVLSAGGVGRGSLAALVGALGGLVVVAGLGLAALAAARMTGYTTDAAVSLFAAADGKLDVARLALTGVVVGSLGALVDLSVGQSRAVLALAAADPDLRGRALYVAAVRGAGAHLASIVSTLAFAYLGAALPLVLLLFADLQPRSTILNGDEMAASIVTVLVASLGLITSVPVATAAAVGLARGRVA